MDSRYLIYYGLLLGGVLLGAIAWKRLSAAYRWLTAYVLLVALCEFTSRVMGYLYSNSMPVYHVLVPLQTLGYCFIYSHILTRISAIRWVWIGGVVIIFLSLLNSMFLQSLWIMNSNGINLLTLFVVVLVLTSFFQMIRDPGETLLLKTPLFWLNLGNLFYPATFLFFGYYNLYGRTPEWGVQFLWMANMIMYGSFAVAIFLASRPGPLRN